MRVKVGAQLIAKSRGKDSWSTKKGEQKNTRRISKIADLGNNSYLEKECYKIEQIEDNNDHKILEQ